MIEIIVLIFLTKKIGILAESKGLSATRWKFYLIGAWILAELIGVIIGFSIFGKDNIVSCMLIALACAATSYFILTNHLNKLPDVFDDEIDNIGR